MTMTIECDWETESWRITDGTREVRLSHELLESWLANQGFLPLFGGRYRCEDGREFCFQVSPGDEWSAEDRQVLNTKVEEALALIGSAFRVKAR